VDQEDIVDVIEVVRNREVEHSPFAGEEVHRA